MCNTAAQGTHALMQQPHIVSMCNTETRRPYPRATATHSQLHLLGRTAHDLVQLEGVCRVLLSETALLHPSPAHMTMYWKGYHMKNGITGYARYLHMCESARLCTLVFYHGT